MLEVLAARHRLGETHWTFPRSQSRIAEALAAKGLVNWQGGVVSGTIRVTLTDAGKAACLSDTYVSPGATANDC